MGFLVPTGLLILALGLAQLLLPGLWWRMHAWSKRVDGVQAERTDEWDTWRGCGGVFLVLFGLVVAGYGCSQRKKSPDRTAPASAPHEQILFDGDLPPEVREAILKQLEEKSGDDR